MSLVRLGQSFFERRRLASVSIYGIVNALPQLSSALLAIIYTSSFSLKEYGGFGILSVVVGLVGITLDMGVPQAVLRHYYDIHLDWKAARGYLSNMIFGARLVALAALPLLGAVLYLASLWFGAGQAYIFAYIALVLATAFFERSVQIYSEIFRALERPVHYAAINAVQSVAQLAGGLIFVVTLNLGIVGALLSMLASRLAASFLSYFLLRTGYGIHGGTFRYEEMRAGLVFGLPLVPNKLAGWARSAALRPALVKVVPVAQVGLYSLAFSISAFPLVASSAVDLALSPYYFKRRVAGAEGFTRRVEDFGAIFAAVLAPLWAFAILFSPELIRTFTVSRYFDAAPMCAVLLCTSFVRSQLPFLSRQIQFLRQTWLLPATSIPSAIFSIVCAMALAFKYGVIAACWGTFVAELALYIALSAAVQKYERIHHPLALVLGLTAVLCLFAYWVAAGDYQLPGWRNIALKAGLVSLLSFACFSLWIWPHRSFIRRLVGVHA